MGKLFGTDGIRGVANETLDAKLAYRVGQAAAISLCDDSGTKPTVVIGKDTRISSDMLEGALVAGLTACGCNAILLGVVPTPAVAYLTIYLHADAGVVISASHNPYEHNGIKMFSSEGFKLNDALEARIEELILQDGELPVKTHGEIGQVMSGSFAAEYYLDHLASTVDGLEPLRVLIDCANGAASTTARYLFGRFPLEAEYLNDKPNGVNINNGCGSTHLEALCDAVKAGGYDLGIAFDGDADRCLTVDEQGCVIDGDKMMAICAAEMEKKGPPARRRLRRDGHVEHRPAQILRRARPAAFVRVGRRPERIGAHAERGCASAASSRAISSSWTTCQPATASWPRCNSSISFPTAAKRPANCPPPCGSTRSCCKMSA